MKLRKKSLLLPAALLVMCRLAGADIATETRLGDTAFEAGDFANAAQFYDSAMTLAKDDENRWPELALKLGEARLRTGNLPGARELLNEYRTRFPARSAGLLPAEILMAEGHVPEAEKFLEMVIANSTEPELACRAKFLLAYAKIDRKDYADAVSGFEQLERENADLPEWAERAHLATIYTLLLAGEYEEADALLAKGKYRNVDPIRYRELELLSKMHQGGDFALFRKQWPQLLTDSHERPGLLLSELALIGAQAAEKADAGQQAGDLLNAAFRLAVNDVLRKEALLRLINLQSKDNPALAASTIERYLEFYPTAADYFALQMRAGRLLVEAKQYSAALENYRKLVHDGRLPATARFEASKEAATAAELAGEQETAVEMLQNLTEDTDSEARRSEGRYLLGEYYFRHREYRKAAAEFRRVPAESERSDDARYQLLQALIELNAYSDAIPVAEELRNSKQPEHVVTADYTRALLREKTGQSGPARSGYLKFIATYPQSRYHAAACYRAAAIAFDTKEFAAAGREFLAYAQKFPKSAQTAAALYQAIQAADFVGDEKLSEEALKLLDREFPGSDVAVDARLQLADSRLARRQWNQAEKLLTDAATLGAARNPDVAAEVLYDRARIAIGQGKTKEADELLTELLKSHVASAIAADAALLRGNLAADKGDFTLALAQYRRAAELHPSGLFGEISKGRIADCRYALYSENMEAEDLKAAMTLYRELAADSGSEQLRLQSLYKLGKCEELAGEPEKALASYDRALYLALDLRRRDLPPDPAWSAKSAYNAAQLYLKKGTIDGAENALRILDIFEELQLPTVDDFSRIRQDIQRKFNLQEKK